MVKAAQELVTLRLYEDLRRCENNIRYVTIEMNSFHNRINRLEQSLGLCEKRLADLLRKQADMQRSFAEQYHYLFLTWSRASSYNGPLQWEDYCRRNNLPYYEVWNENSRAADL